MLGINKIKIISMATMQTLFREKRKGKEEAGKESSLGVKKKKTQIIEELVSIIINLK